MELVGRRAEMLVGMAFLVLAAYVTCEALSSILGGEGPDASPVGIVLTAVSIPVMLWLAAAKRRTGEALRSRALVADSKQTRACWYLSVVALAGLVANAVLGWWLADPLAALGIAVLLVRERREAVPGEEDD
jgi:divalent metal cation (Fe/Co/Zn/Cd) transporter